MMGRNTWRWCDYEVGCQDCGWQTHGKNALGNAARHHDRTGHTVRTEIRGVVTYPSDAEHDRMRREKAAQHG